MTSDPTTSSVTDHFGPSGLPSPRESRLSETLVALADSLVDDFDVVDLLTMLAERCVEVLDVSAAGLMLAAPDGDLRVVAWSSDEMRLLEIFELESEEGPCLDCYRSGDPVVNQALATASVRWPRFAPAAIAAGFRSAHALPMRLRRNVIGALNLFRVNEGMLGPSDVVAAQALADVATIAILQNRASTEAQLLNDQLQHALDSRIVLEQAKGMVAEHEGIDLGESFNRLRTFARRRNFLLADVATRVVDGSLTFSEVSRG